MAKKKENKPRNNFDEGTNKLIKGIKNYFKILVTLLIGYIALQYVSFKYYPILFSAYSIYPYWKNDDENNFFWTNVVAFHKEDCNPQKPFIIDTLKNKINFPSNQNRSDVKITPVYKEIYYSNLESFKNISRGIYILRKLLYIIFGTVQIFLNYFCGIAFFFCSIIMLVIYPIIKGFSFLSGNFTTFLFNNYSYKINLNAIYELIPESERTKLFKFPLESLILNKTFEPNMNFFPTLASYLTSIGNFGVDNLLYKNKYFKRNAFRYEFECPEKGDKSLTNKNFIKGWINLGIDFLLGIGVVWLLHFSIARGFTFEGGPNVMNSFKFGLIFIFILLFFMIFGLNTHFLPTLFKPFTTNFGDQFKKDCNNSKIDVKNLTDMHLSKLIQTGEMKYVNDIILKYKDNPLLKKLKNLL